MEAIPIATKQIPKIGKKIGAPMVDAIIVQPMPKTETIMPAKPFIMDGPLPGFILFMKSPPKILYFILPYFCEKSKRGRAIRAASAYIKTDIIKKF